MSAVAKVLVPNKTWIVEDSGIKLGTLNKEKKGYSFFRQGTKISVSASELNEKFGLALFEESLKKTVTKVENISNEIYDFPCSSRPYQPVYNIKKRLPIYAKSAKSKSLYCAGYYVIKFRKGWVKSFCPKLITLERYPYQGPFKTESEMRAVLNVMSKQ